MNNDFTDNKLKKIYQNPEFSDVTFIIGEKEEQFKAHKLLLSVNSHYFESLFYPKGWKTVNYKKVEEVRFINVQPEVFRSVLEFNYTNTLNTEAKLIYRLISTSLILEFPDLYIACLEYLISPPTKKECEKNGSQTKQKETSEEKVISQSPLMVALGNVTFLKGLGLWLSGRSDIGITEYDLFCF